MLNSAFGIAIFLIGIGPVLAVDSPLTNYEVAARDFAYEKMNLGTKIDDFVRLSPAAKKSKQDSNDKSKYVYFYTVAEDKNVHIGHSFLDDRLYQIQILYSDVYVAKSGGHEILAKKLLKKLGEIKPENLASDDRTGTLKASWIFPRPCGQTTVFR